MKETVQEWLNRILRRFPNRERMSLMTWIDGDYYVTQHIENPAKWQFNVYPDLWFTAPTTLVKQWEHAWDLANSLEDELDKWREANGHHKYIDHIDYP